MSWRRSGSGERLELQILLILGFWKGHREQKASLSSSPLQSRKRDNSPVGRAPLHTAVYFLSQIDQLRDLTINSRLTPPVDVIAHAFRDDGFGLDWRFKIEVFDWNLIPDTV